MDGLITPNCCRNKIFENKTKIPILLCFPSPFPLGLFSPVFLLSFLPVLCFKGPTLPYRNFNTYSYSPPIFSPTQTQLYPTQPNFTQLGRKFAVTHLTLSRMVDGCNQLPALCEETAPNVTRIQADDEHVIKLMVNGQLIIAMGLCSIVLGYAP